MGKPNSCTNDQIVPATMVEQRKSVTKGGFPEPYEEWMKHCHQIFGMDTNRSMGTAAVRMAADKAYEVAPPHVRKDFGRVFDGFAANQSGFFKNNLFCYMYPGKEVPQTLMRCKRSIHIGKSCP